MKVKIISFVVVIVFVMSMFPANVFAHLPAHGCQEGEIAGTSANHRTSGTEGNHSSTTEGCDNSASGLSVLLGLAFVGLIVWAVWPKDTYDTNLEEVEDNLSATESTNNWGWTASYNYEEDSYSLGASYGF